MFHKSVLNTIYLPILKTRLISSIKYTQKVTSNDISCSLVLEIPLWRVNRMACQPIEVNDLHCKSRTEREASFTKGKNILTCDYLLKVRVYSSILSVYLNF